MKKILKIVIVSVIVSGGIFFSVSKTDANQCDNSVTLGGCGASTITVSPGSTSSTITVSGSVKGGYSTQYVFCESNLGLNPPQSIGLTSNYVTYSVDGVNGTAPVTITQQMQDSSYNNCKSFLPETGTYSFSIPNPYPTFQPWGYVSFLDAYQSFGAPSVSTLNAAPVLPDKIPSSFNVSETKTVGIDSNPLNIVMQNTGTSTWTSDSKTAVASSASGTCQVDTDGDGVKDAPAETSANDGASCTVTYNYSSSQFKLRNTSSPSNFTYVQPGDLSYSKAVNVTRTLVYSSPTQDCTGYNNNLDFNYNKVLDWLSPKALAAKIGGGTCTTTPGSYFYESSNDVSPDIAPGGTATFNISSMKAPTTSGIYTEKWNMADSGTTFGTPLTKTIIVLSGDIAQGNLTVDSCNNIPVNGNSCNVHLTWNVTNKPLGSTSAVTSAIDNFGSSVNSSGVSYNSIGGFHASDVDSGTNVPVNTFYTGASTPASRTFYLYNNGFSLVQGGVPATATCITGTTWDSASKTCLGPGGPGTSMYGTLTSESPNCPVTSGNTCTVKLDWSINNPETHPAAITDNSDANIINVTSTLVTPQSGTKTVTVTSPGTTFYLYDYSVIKGESIQLAMVNVPTTASGVWSLGSCVANSGASCVNGTENGTESPVCSAGAFGNCDINTRPASQSCIITCGGGQCSNPANHSNPCASGSTVDGSITNGVSSWTWYCKDSSGNDSNKCTELKKKPIYKEN